MANRPIFIPNKSNLGVDIKNIEFKWFPGMSISQKQKSIESLHEAANRKGITSILEISSKSKENLGVDLSSFNLKIRTRKNRLITVESAFQSSKIFEKGGPYKDLLGASSREAKKDERLRNSGRLIGFEIFDKEFPLIPRSFFYDWLYVNALSNHQEMCIQIIDFNAFTDIEFNPKKSINCQAYSAALFVTLKSNKRINEALEAPESFLNTLKDVYKSKDGNFGNQSRIDF